MRNPAEPDSHFATTRSLVRRAPPQAGSGVVLAGGPTRIGEGGLRSRGWFKASSPETPLVSVITVVRNAAAVLEQTIRSVLEQTYHNVEYLVIDGASGDGTLDVLQHYDRAIDYWVSEPDSGISEAFNKGIELSTGELIGLLNAGDRYEPQAIAAVVAARDARQRFAIYHGDLVYCREDGTAMYRTHPDLSKIWRYMSVFHPTMLVEREVYRRIGLYSPQFRYAMDSELVHRAVRAGVRFVYVPRTIAAMRLGGRSHREYRRAFAEFRDSVILHGGPRLPAYWRYGAAVLKRSLLRYRAGRALKGLRDRLRGRVSPLLWP
jgi:glycosyltransferase involved in cell wall biosynthesis